MEWTSNLGGTVGKEYFNGDQLKRDEITEGAIMIWLYEGDYSARYILTTEEIEWNTLAKEETGKNEGKFPCISKVQKYCK